MADPAAIDFQKYLRLIRKVKAGEVLTKKELAYVVEFKQDVDTGAIDKVKDTEEFKKLTPEEQGELSREALDASTKLLFQDPAYKESLVDLAKEAEQGKLSEKITTGLNIALAGTDIISSIGQVKAADRSTRRARRPTRPTPLTASPELANAITQAQAGNFDAARALAPAQLAILDNYLSDLNMARTASTGQAGTYGALGQVASTRRNRASAELAPIADSITARNQARLDDLLTMKLRENANIQQSQSQAYPYDVQQYQFDLESANNQRNAGMGNLRSSVDMLATQLPQTIAKMATQKRYNDIYNTMSQYGADNASLAGKTSVDVASRHNGTPYNPSWLEEIY